VSAPLLLVLALLAGADAVVHPKPLACARGVQRVELRPEPLGKVPEVCLSPRLATVFSFDAELEPGSLLLEGADRFATIEPGGTLLKLVPSEKLLAGERLRLVLRIKDGAVPASAVFWLVVDPDSAGSLVQVYRHPRSVESLLQKVEEQDTLLRQCWEENSRLRAQEPVVEGLMALLEEGLLNLRGVATHNLTAKASLAQPSAHRLRLLHSYLSSGRVAVELGLEPIQPEREWTAAGAELIGPERQGLRVLRLRQRELLRHGTVRQRILIEAEASPEQAQGSFTLRLWGADGTGEVLIHGVTFP